MAYTAHRTEEEIKEFHDNHEELEIKLDELAKLVQNSQHFVIFTGAGISTAAGISDFRGPNGVWTLKAQGKTPAKSRSSLKAIPTTTHMAIVELQNHDICKYLISQNCDGLHRRSGIKADKISELHGNGNIEFCEDCGCEYLRDFHCTRLKRGSDHYTGRHCVMQMKGKVCGGRLMNSTIDFGQNLPERPLKLASKHSIKADLHLVLGSSLTVQPACLMPQATVFKTLDFGEIDPVKALDDLDSQGTLVICNLQKTPLDKYCDLRFFATCDEVMSGLMKRLDIPIPDFVIRKYFSLKYEMSKDFKKVLFSIKAHEYGTSGNVISASIFEQVHILLPPPFEKIYPLGRRFSLDAEPFELSLPYSAANFETGVALRLVFKGNYNEVPYVFHSKFPKFQPDATQFTNFYKLTLRRGADNWELEELPNL